MEIQRTQNSKNNFGKGKAVRLKLPALESYYRTTVINTGGIHEKRDLEQQKRAGSPGTDQCT